MGTRAQQQVLKALLVGGVLALLGACAGMTAAPSNNPQADARAAVSLLTQRYENPQSERFFDLVDDSRFPNYDGFMDRVRTFQIQNRAIQLDVIVDGVDANAPAVGVRAHWNKSYVDPKGTNKLLSGECEFLFRRQPSGGLLLTAVQGASPF